MILIPILIVALQSGRTAVPARPVPASAVPSRVPADATRPDLTPGNANPVLLLDGAGVEAPTQPSG